MLNIKSSIDILLYCSTFMSDEDLIKFSIMFRTRYPNYQQPTVLSLLYRITILKMTLLSVKNIRVILLVFKNSLSFSLAIFILFQWSKSMLSDIIISTKRKNTKNDRR
jgi:hypothetical protein